jgi:putative flippase GtrA
MNNIFFDKKFYFFTLIGLPTYIIALILNYSLVEILLLNYEISYAITLTLLIISNFLLNFFVVFKSNDKKNIYKKFFYFLILLIFFRFLDWFVYMYLVINFKIWYLFVQIFNTLVFLLIKYRISRSIFLD